MKEWISSTEHAPWQAGNSFASVAGDTLSFGETAQTVRGFGGCFNELGMIALRQLSDEERALVFRILTYIEEHYTEDITLPEMAEALSYEYHYLSRVLREDLHIGFRSLINQRRCERARELISDGDQPLSTIAMLCGFRSLRTFNRAFLAETGITPSAMRRGARSAR